MRYFPISTSFSFVLLSSILFLSSCSDSEKIEYLGISGTVTYKNKPLPYGTIIFEPDASAGNTGAQGFASIENGTYNTKLDGRGILGGPYTVFISGQAQKTDAEAGIIPPPLFPDFQMKVNLPKASTTQNFDVPAQTQQ